VIEHQFRHYNDASAGAAWSGSDLPASADVGDGELTNIQGRRIRFRAADDDGDEGIQILVERSGVTPSRARITKCAASTGLPKIASNGRVACARPRFKTGASDLWDSPSSPLPGPAISRIHAAVAASRPAARHGSSTSGCACPSQTRNI
jgi:hypothetical protein